MKRWLLILVALVAFSLAACRAPAGEPGSSSGSAEPSETPAASETSAASEDPYDY
jgi:hypothetical protein